VRALIVGAGAVGMYLAARLRLGGHDVVLLARPQGAAALRAQGVTLRVGAQEWPVSVEAADDPADPLLAEPFELAIVAVKSIATSEAIASLRAVRGCAESTVLTVQNGLGNEEALAQAFGADRIAAGALTTAVQRRGASDVDAVASGGLSFAPMGSAPHNWFLAAFDGTGLLVQAAGDWRSLKWSKLCINLIANGVCAVLDWTPNQVYGDATAFAVERSCLDEAFATMRRLRIAPIGLVGFPVPLLAGAVMTLPAPLLRAVLRGRVGTARGEKLPSLLLDLRAGRTNTEVGDLNGAVAARARDAGLAVQANAAVARIVSGIADGSLSWDSYRAAPQALAAAAAVPP
jgi:2-dehydropantoate 2-reductase